MSAIADRATNEVISDREAVEALALERKAVIEDRIARAEAQGIKLGDGQIGGGIEPREKVVHELATRAGAVTSEDVGGATETASQRATRARKMLAEGFQVSRGMLEAIRIDDQFREQEADAAEALRRRVTAAGKDAAEALGPEIDAYIDAAEAWIAARTRYTEKLTTYESLTAAARRTGAAIPHVENVVSMRARLDGGSRIRALDAALQKFGWGL